jgi:hypothetical protein
MPDRKVPNFESFDAELRAAELKVLTEITPELARDRQNMVSAFQRMGVARAELGKAIAAYHVHFKEGRAWLKITPVLLKWIDRTSPTTLYNLMGDAERDQSLSSPRRAAMIRSNLNPATRRNAGIVGQLAGGRDDESPEVADQAVRAAVKASKTKLAAPKQKNPAAVPQSDTLEKLAAEEIARAEDFAKIHPEVNRERIASAVISSFREWAGISASHAPATNSKTTRQVESKRQARDKSKAQKVVSMADTPQRKSPKPEPTLLDFGAGHLEIA